MESRKTLNTRKIRGVTKYLVYLKGSIAGNNIWEKKENLKNTKKTVVKFEKKDKN